MKQVVPMVHSVTEAAALLGVSPSRVYQLLQEGVLERLHLAGSKTKLVTASSIQRLLKQRGQAA